MLIRGFTNVYKYSTNVVTKTPIFRPRIPYLYKASADNVKLKTFRPRSALRFPIVEKSTCSTGSNNISNTSVHPQCGQQSVKTKNDEVAVKLKNTSKLSLAQLSPKKVKDVILGKSEPSCSTRESAQTVQRSLTERLRKGIIFNTDEVSIEEKGFIEIPNQKPSEKSPYMNKVETKGSQKTPVVKADKKVQGSTATSSKPVHLPSKSEETLKSKKSNTGFFSRSPFVKKTESVKDNDKSKKNQPSIKNTCSENKKNETVPKCLHKNVNEKLRKSLMKDVMENKTKTMTVSTEKSSKPVHIPCKSGEALKNTKSNTCNETITPTTENAEKSKKNEPTVKNSCSDIKKNETESKSPHKDVTQKSQNAHMKNATEIKTTPGSTVTCSKPIQAPCKSEEALKSTKSNTCNETITPTTKNAEKSKKNEPTIKNSCSDIKKNESEPKCSNKDVNQKSQNSHLKNASENKTTTGSTMACSKPVQAPCKSEEVLKSIKSNTCNETITPTMKNTEKSKKNQSTINNTCLKKETEPKCAHTDVDRKSQKEKMPTSCTKTNHCGDSANTTAAPNKSQCGSVPSAVAQEVEKKSTCHTPPPPPIPCDLRQLVNPLIQTSMPDEHSQNSKWTQLLSWLKKYFKF